MILLESKKISAKNKEKIVAGAVNFFPIASLIFVIGNIVQLGWTAFDNFFATETMQNQNHNSFKNFSIEKNLNEEIFLPSITNKITIFS